MLTVGRLLSWGVVALLVAMLGKYVPFCPLGLTPPTAINAGWMVVGAVGLWGLIGLPERRWRALIVAAVLAGGHRVCVIKRPAAEALAHRLLVSVNDDPTKDITNCFPTVEVRQDPGLVRFVFYDDLVAGTSALVFTSEGTARVRQAVGSAAVPAVYDAHWYWQTGKLR
jgi:hypothetical protein